MSLRTEIAAQLRIDLGISWELSEKAAASALKTITNVVTDSPRTVFPDLGVFHIEQKQPRNVRLFGGRLMTIPPAFRLTFKPQKSLKKELAQAHGGSND
ncbi:MAG: HU family DNA-binding protein [Marinobacterium sp.]|nr:HU family DNA-binding protein [Marinobacterium sp.]